MSYNPYANIADEESKQTNRLHQPQPHRATASINSQQFQQNQSFQQTGPQVTGQQYDQFGQSHINYAQTGAQNHPQQSSQFYNQANGGANPIGGAPQYSNFFNDPKAAMTFQVGQNAMLAGSHFVEQNINKYVATGDIKYYFKVSNHYVLSKLLLILFPFKNKNWTRSYRQSNEPTQTDNNAELYAFPLNDNNAPDLYIPLMGSVTYILTIALISGLKGEFHPEVFGFKTSSTIAYLLLDLVVLKLGLYLLNITSKTWDLISYIGYKFVPIVLILLIKNISNWRAFNWFSYFYLLLSFGYFELRAIRFNLFSGLANSAQTLNSKSLKNSNYFLFVYSFLFQGAVLWLLS